MTEGQQAKKAQTRTREQIVRLNHLGREWLKGFFAAIRTVHFHDPINKIFDEPIAQLTGAGNAILKEEARTEVRILEEQFFLNGLWIKPALGERNILFSLAAMLTKNGLGGITLRASVSPEQWRAFLAIYREAKGPQVKRWKEINSQLGQQGIEHIELHPVFELKEEGPQDRPLPPEAFHAATAYAKALLCMREFARCEEGEERVAVFRKAQRLTCELIDICENTPRLFAALTLLRNFDSYFFHHGVNASILSLLLAHEVGVQRTELVDLGMASLLHDVGKFSIPEYILEKPGKLTTEEWEMMKRHPIESAKTFLTLGYLNTSVAERVLVAYQHHWASRAPDAYPQPRRNLEPSLMADIVAVSVRYDSLTTFKQYRAGVTPWEAIRILAAESERDRYRPEILNAFLRLMGPLPVGSWVAFEDGREGIVAAAGSLAETAPYPIVYVPAAEEEERWVDCGKTSKRTGKKEKFLAKYTSNEMIHKAMAGLFKDSEVSPLT